MKLIKALPEYKIETINMFFDDPSNATSGEVWKYLNAQMGKAAPSRASVIFFLNHLVQEGYLEHYQDTGKGGFHNVYYLNLSKEEFIAKIYKNTQEELDQLLAPLEKKDVAIESRKLTNTQIAEIAIPHLNKFLKNGKISTSKLKATLETDCRIRVGNNRSYDIKDIILKGFPQEE